MVVDVDLGKRSYLIYISPGLLDETPNQQGFARVVASCGYLVILMSSPPRHVIGKRAQRRQEAVYAAGRGPLPKDQAKW
jgi:hypothetical protein